MEYSHDKMEIRLDVTEDEGSDDPCRPLTEAIRSIRRELRLQRERMEELVARMDGLEKPEGGERREPCCGNERALAHALACAIDEFGCALERFQSALSLAAAGKPEHKACAPAKKPHPVTVTAHVRRRKPVALRARIAAVKVASGQGMAPADADSGAAAGVEEAAELLESPAVLTAVSDAAFEDAMTNDKEKVCQTAAGEESAASYGEPVGEGEQVLETGPQEPEGKDQHEQANAGFEEACPFGRLSAAARRLRDIAEDSPAAL